jgi:peptidoglycan hydrolase CwlO-like protein
MALQQTVQEQAAVVQRLEHDVATLRGGIEELQQTAQERDATVQKLEQEITNLHIQIVANAEALQTTLKTSGESTGKSESFPGSVRYGSGRRADNALLTFS